MNNFSEELATALDAAKTASKILLKYYKSEESLNVSKKGRIERVTDADLQAEKEIRKILEKKFPHYNISGEEYGDTEFKSDYKWYLDPLCGSNEFVHALPEFGLSIALTYKDELALGVCALPAFSETFWAVRGGGAFCNGEEIRVSSISEPEEAMFTTHVSVKFENINPAVKLLSKIGKYNMLMPGAFPYAVCNLARGRIDGHIELNVKPVHRLAATMIAVEAGGVWSRIDGKSPTIFDNDIIISNKFLHKQILEILK